jgi:hypothetical protein
VAWDRDNRRPARDPVSMPEPALVLVLEQVLEQVPFSESGSA